MKKGISIIATLIAFCIMFNTFAFATCTSTTNAFNVPSSSRYAKVYTLNRTGQTIPYTSKSLTTRGTTSGSSNSAYIDNQSDELWLYDVGQTNGKAWALVSYPIGGRSRRTAYIKLSALSWATYGGRDLYYASSLGRFNCAPRKGSGTSSSYYVDKGDPVYVFRYNYDGYAQIMYPVDGNNKWRIAFAAVDTLSKYLDGKGLSKSNTSIQLNVPFFNQYDARWSNSYIGSKTIGRVGCTTTCLAMMYSYNNRTTCYPNEMRYKLSYSNNDLIWSSLTNVGLSYSNAYNCSLNYSIMNSIYSKLKAGRPVMIGCNGSSRGQHWVVVTGYTGSSTNSFSASDFIINDPGSANDSTLAQFVQGRGTVVRLAW